MTYKIGDIVAAIHGEYVYVINAVNTSTATRLYNSSSTDVEHCISLPASELRFATPTEKALYFTEIKKAALEYTGPGLRELLQNTEVLAKAIIDFKPKGKNMIHPHKDEIVKWANGNYNVGVWWKPKNSSAKWSLKHFSIAWAKEADYIIDDEWATIRKFAIDNGYIYFKGTKFIANIAWDGDITDYATELDPIVHRCDTCGLILQELAHNSKHTKGSYCSIFCAAVADHKRIQQYIDV